MLIKIRAQLPEIFFGSLLAVAIFSLGVVYQSSRQQPSGQNSSDAANNSGSPKAPDESPKITDWFLLLSNLFLVGSTLMLWRANNQSAKIAEEALTQLERPFVGVKILEEGLFNLREGSEHSSMKFLLVNYGRAPAIITQLFDYMDICQFGVMPEPPDITSNINEIPSGFIIRADAEAHRPSTRVYSQMFSDIELRALTMGTDDIFFLGFIRYRDIGNKKYRTGFCLKWSVPDDGQGSFPFLFEGDERYNYTTEE
jgi:hypothetical protein